MSLDKNSLVQPLEAKVEAFVFTPIFLLGLVWLGFSVLVIFSLENDPDRRSSAFAWMIGLWSLCVLDLMVLIRAVQSVFRQLAAPETRPWVVVWSLLKFACFGLLGIGIYQAKNIPLCSLLLGTGTLLSVPLMSAMGLNQRIAFHA